MNDMKVTLSPKIKKLIDEYIEKKIAIIVIPTERYTKLIKGLLDHLPDSIHSEDESWQWCWDELSGDAQDKVKEIRELSKKALDEIARMGEANNQPRAKKVARFS